MPVGIDAEPLATDLSIWMPSIYGKNADRQARNDAPVWRGRSRRRADARHAGSCRATEGPGHRVSQAGIQFCSRLLSPIWRRSFPACRFRPGMANSTSSITAASLLPRRRPSGRIRRSEENVLNAEKFASLASLYGRSYPQDGMELHLEESAVRSLSRHHAGLGHCGELSGREAQSGKCGSRGE